MDKFTKEVKDLHTENWKTLKKTEETEINGKISMLLD
jgi:hypothetical protein